MIKYLAAAGRITTPAAMVVFMAYEINRSMEVSGYWSAFVLFGAILTAAGVEIVGILSGSTLEGFWRQGDATRAALSLILLIIYTAAAVFILRHNPTLIPVPIVAAVVYIVSALADSLGNQEQRQETAERDAINYERQQDAIREQREHEARLRKEELAAQVKIERAKAKAVASKAPTVSGQNDRHIPADWRQLSDSQKRELADVPPEQLVELTDISLRTAERWRNRLDEIAARNGHAAG